MLVSLFVTWFGEKVGLVLARILPYLLGVALMAGLVLYLRADAYDDGVVDTTRKYEERMSAERERLREANRRAAEEADRQIDRLNRLLRNRNADLEQLRREAQEDPNSDSESINPDGVRRLNRIR